MVASPYGAVDKDNPLAIQEYIRYQKLANTGGLDPFLKGIYERLSNTARFGTNVNLYGDNEYQNVLGMNANRALQGMETLPGNNNFDFRMNAAIYDINKQLEEKGYNPLEYYSTGAVNFNDEARRTSIMSQALGQLNTILDGGAKYLQRFVKIVLPGYNGGIRIDNQEQYDRADAVTQSLSAYLEGYEEHNPFITSSSPNLNLVTFKPQDDLTSNVINSEEEKEPDVIVKPTEKPEETQTDLPQDLPTNEEPVKPEETQTDLPQDLPQDLPTNEEPVKPEETQTDLPQDLPQDLPTENPTDENTITNPLIQPEPTVTPYTPAPYVPLIDPNAENKSNNTALIAVIILVAVVLLFGMVFITKKGGKK